MGTKAKESVYIKKAREKLKKELAKADKKITERALYQMSRIIHRWIDRHAEERVPIKFEFFDENRHSAKTKSKFIRNLLTKLRKESKKAKKLKGRIKKG